MLFLYFFLWITAGKNIFLSEVPRYSLTVEVSNIKLMSGEIRVCLANSDTIFLKKCFLEGKIQASSSRVKILFQGLKQGTYAVSVHHDENANGEVDLGFMGIPKESFGFSNNPAVYFGPPAYSKCTFTLSENKLIGIKL